MDNIELLENLSVDLGRVKADRETHFAIINILQGYKQHLQSSEEEDIDKTPEETKE